MIKTIKELLIEWWAETTTTKMPLPTIYTYYVEVDGKRITIESMSRSRIYVHYKARKKYPNALHQSGKTDNIDKKLHRSMRRLVIPRNRSRV